mgnify:FL=1
MSKYIVAGVIHGKTEDEIEASSPEEAIRLGNELVRRKATSFQFTESTWHSTCEPVEK